MFHAELADVALFGAMPRFGDMNMHGVIDLRRRFKRAEIERAVEAALGAFPVLDCRYEPGFLRDVWRPVERPISDIVHVIDEPSDLETETEDWVRSSVDVTRERPLRVVSLGRKEGSRMILTFSHIAVDGAGAAAVGHVLGAKLYGVSPAAPTDPRRGLDGALDRLSFYHLPIMARETASVVINSKLTRSAAPRERPYGAPGSPQASYRHIVISAEQTARLKERSRAAGASLNDALVAGIARAAAKRSSGGPVSVIYTMDLRRYQRSPRLTATNTSSILAGLVARSALGDFESAARAVASLTARHRESLTGPALLLGAIALFGKAPHGLVRELVPKLLPDLVDLPLSRGLMVTNVGRLDDGLAMFGDDIEAMRVVGPMLRGADVPAVIAYGFRGEIQLELFSCQEIGPTAGEELEAELREALDV